MISLNKMLLCLRQAVLKRVFFVDVFVSQRCCLVLDCLASEGLLTYRRLLDNPGAAACSVRIWLHYVDGRPVIKELFCFSGRAVRFQDMNKFCGDFSKVYVLSTNCGICTQKICIRKHLGGVLLLAIQI